MSQVESPYSESVQEEESNLEENSELNEKTNSDEKSEENKKDSNPPSTINTNPQGSKVVPSANQQPIKETYVVKVGDTLNSISKKVLGNKARFDEIMKLNNIDSPSQLRVGQVLRIPPK